MYDVGGAKPYMNPCARAQGETWHTMFCAGVVISGQLTWTEEPKRQQLACAVGGGVGRCGSGDGRGKDVQYDGTQ